jgi:hypothetical protein
VSLADEIFPDGRHPDLVQTEWAAGWGYGSIGFAEAARFLTKNRAKFHATIDQVGLVIFFLQRHRVELALKELLLAHGGDLAEIKPPHSLNALWKACEQAVGVGSEGWQHLGSAGTELVALLHERDPGSDTYRYPVDRAGKKHKRPKFINLVALEEHVDALASAIGGYMAYSDEARRWEEDMHREYEQEMRREYGDDDYGR